MAMWGAGAAAQGVAPRPDANDAGDGRPFAVVDKRAATLSVYAADGRLLGRTAALLGLTPGDAQAPGSRGKAPEALNTQERTTPAGRFEARPGHNIHGERIVWIDYEASLAIHRLRPAPARERRPERLASANPQDHRITLGCVVVEPAFFEGVVLPSLGSGAGGLVYILPEREPVVVAGGGVPHAAAP
ncbi:L,D-transpeptidase [Roseateles saccharophilus]|uniref:L,D-transpeptidase-like protein n=1 Tax=Roseateles saccharophilus TaxID=304 RepID=A0A4R3UKK9_ROSSA|nr:L,D-transpeptidase [Roseateles saccharophilus]MDG0834022.1 L,D-transpeptidase [Roseateles saccharophilus]TCU90960.1 hypothetical protein EV671_102838 [Roseateles saccharophilus]